MSSGTTIPHQEQAQDEAASSTTLNPEATSTSVEVPPAFTALDAAAVNATDPNVAPTVPPADPHNGGDHDASSNAVTHGMNGGGGQEVIAEQQPQAQIYEHPTAASNSVAAEAEAANVAVAASAEVSHHTYVHEQIMANQATAADAGAAVDVAIPMEGTNPTQQQDDVIQIMPAPEDVTTTTHAMVDDDDNNTNNNNTTDSAKGGARKDFEFRLNEMKEYKEKHGHLMVPHKNRENPSLGTWVDTQRRRYRVYMQNKNNGNATASSGGDGRGTTMSEEHIAKLKEIGFQFEPRLTREETWNKRIEELKAYQLKHNHCNVREDDKSNPGLGKWVSYVRRQFRLQKRGKRERGKRLTEERMEQLLQFGFVFELKEAQASKRFSDGIKFLKEYYEHQRHVNVPKIYLPNPTLGLCVEEMRKIYRKICSGSNNVQMGNLFGMERSIVCELSTMGFLAEEGIFPPQWITQGTAPPAQRQQLQAQPQQKVASTKASTGTTTSGANTTNDDVSKMEAVDF